MPHLVLFLCTGNYYRSRYAELWFNARARAQSLTWRAESAGLAPQCWTRNAGAISPAVLPALASRGVILRDPARLPRDVTEAQVRSAERVVLLSDREHRAPFEARFSSGSVRVTGWDIDDIDRCPPEIALRRIEELVEALLDELVLRQTVAIGRSDGVAID